MAKKQIELPLVAKVLRSDASYKAGQEVTITTANELEGAMRLHRAGYFEVPGYDPKAKGDTEREKVKEPTPAEPTNNKPKTTRKAKDK